MPICLAAGELTNAVCVVTKCVLSLIPHRQLAGAKKEVGRRALDLGHFPIIWTLTALIVTGEHGTLRLMRWHVQFWQFQGRWVERFPLHLNRGKVAPSPMLLGIFPPLGGRHLLFMTARTINNTDCTLRRKEH